MSLNLYSTQLFTICIKTRFTLFRLKKKNSDSSDDTSGCTDLSDRLTGNHENGNTLLQTIKGLSQRHYSKVLDHSLRAHANMAVTDETGSKNNKECVDKQNCYLRTALPTNWTVFSASKNDDALFIVDPKSSFVINEKKPVKQMWTFSRH